MLNKAIISSSTILDFSKTCSLYKKDSIFELKKIVLPGYNDLIVVEISQNIGKMIVRADTKVGSKGKLASRYVEKNGKLFFWWDDNDPLTDEAFAIFHKYNLLFNDNGTFVNSAEYEDDIFKIL